MDHSFSGVFEYNGRRYRFERPARRRRDPRADEASWRVRYEYVIPGPNTKRARVAATSQTERLLPEVKAGDASQTECGVCLQDYAVEETIRAMPMCSHAFHLHCISEWLSRSAVCPVCRRELPLPTQEEQQQEEDGEVDENGVPRSWNWVRVPVYGRGWWE